MDATLLARSAAVLAALQRANLTVATAESCTGGLISAALTHHAGSSSAVLGGVVSYANSAKTGILGVPESLLRRVGAVSAEVAEAMATGVLDLTGADIAVSVTGIAGPGGGTIDKPVGTVWLGLAHRSHPNRTRGLALAGDRDAVRLQAADTALSMIAAAIAEG